MKNFDYSHARKTLTAHEEWSLKELDKIEKAIGRGRRNGLVASSTFERKKYHCIYFLSSETAIYHEQQPVPMTIIRKKFRLSTTKKYNYIADRDLENQRDTYLQIRAKEHRRRNAITHFQESSVIIQAGVCFSKRTLATHDEWSVGEVFNIEKAFSRGRRNCLIIF